MNREGIAEKLQQFHNEHNGGRIPVYDGVVVMDNTLTTSGQDVEVVTIVFVKDNSVDDVKHLTLEAAVRLIEAVDNLFDMDDEDEDEDDDEDNDGIDGDDDDDE